MPTTIGLPFEAVPVSVAVTRCSPSSVGAEYSVPFTVASIVTSVSSVTLRRAAAAAWLECLPRVRDVRGYFARFLIEAHNIDFSKAAALVGIGIELIIRRYEWAVAHGSRAACAGIGRPRRAIEAIDVLHIALHAFKPFGLVRHRDGARLSIFVKIDALNIFQIRRAQRALGSYTIPGNGLRRSVRCLEVRHVGIAIFRIGCHNVHRGAEGAVLKRRLGIEHIRAVVGHVGIGNIERSKRVIIVVNVGLCTKTPSETSDSSVASKSLCTCDCSTSTFGEAQPARAASAQAANAIATVARSHEAWFIFKRFICITTSTTQPKDPGHSSSLLK